MKQHMNRITALFLCLAMVIGVLGMLPGAVATASAAQTSAAAGVAPNLLEDLNYSFENGTEDWTFSNAPFYQVVNNEAKVGSSSLKVDTDGIARLIMSNFVDVSGISNLFLSFAQKGTGTTNLFVYYYNDDLDQLTTGGSEWLGGKEATSEWTPIYGSSKVPAGAAYAKLYISRTNDGEVWYDNAIIRDADLKVYAPELRETFEGYAGYGDLFAAGFSMYNNKANSVNGSTDDMTTAKVDGRTVACVNPQTSAGGLYSPYVDVSEFDTVRFSMDIKTTVDIYTYVYLYDSNFNQLSSNSVSIDSTQKNNKWTVLTTELTDVNAAYARVMFQVNKGTSAYIDNICIKGQKTAALDATTIDFETGFAAMYADAWSMPTNVNKKSSYIGVTTYNGSSALYLNTEGSSSSSYAYTPRIYVGDCTQVVITFTSYGTSACTLNPQFYPDLTSAGVWSGHTEQLDTTGNGKQHTITLTNTKLIDDYIGLNFLKSANQTGTTYIDNIVITTNAPQPEDPGVQEEAPLFLHDFNTGSGIHLDPYKWDKGPNLNAYWSSPNLSLENGAWKCPNAIDGGTKFSVKSPAIALNGSEKVKLSARYQSTSYFYCQVQFYNDAAGNSANGGFVLGEQLVGAPEYIVKEFELTVPEGAVSMRIFFTKEYRETGSDSYLDYIQVDHAHVTTEVPEVPATTNAPGAAAHYTCSCGKLFADAEATEQITAPAVIPQLTLEISKKNINMGENLGVIFAVKRSDLTGTHAKYSAKATMPDGTTVIVPFTDWNGVTIEEEGVDYKYFSVTGLAAKEMNDAVEAVILYNGEVVSPVSSLSVREYAEYQLANSNDEKFKIVCVDLLNYGAAAQTHFGYQTNNLANSTLSEEQKGWATAEASLTGAAKNVVKDDTNTNATKPFKVSVRFESDISLMVAIDSNISYTTGKITFTNHNGNEVETPVSFANSKTTNIGGKGYRYMEFTGMVIADLNSDITIKVDEKIEMTYSLAEYVRQASENGSATMQALAEAFGKVSTSAYAYKHPQV